MPIGIYTRTEKHRVALRAIKHKPQQGFQKGHKGQPWLGKHHSEKTKQKMSLIKKGLVPKNLAILHSPDIRKKVGDTRRGKPNLKIRGEKNHLWKGGITPINEKIRASLEYTIWRRAVFERDNYTCIWCGIRGEIGRRVELNADHIKPFSLFPELRFAIDNGRTLCVDCHKKTDTYGRSS